MLSFRQDFCSMTHVDKLYQMHLELLELHLWIVYENKTKFSKLFSIFFLVLNHINKKIIILISKKMINFITNRFILIMQIKRK